MGQSKITKCSRVQHGTAVRRPITKLARCGAGAPRMCAQTCVHARCCARLTQPNSDASSDAAGVQQLWTCCCTDNFYRAQRPRAPPSRAALGTDTLVRHTHTLNYPLLQRTRLLNSRRPGEVLTSYTLAWAGSVPPTWYTCARASGCARPRCAHRVRPYPTMYTWHMRQRSFPAPVAARAPICFAVHRHALLYPAAARAPTCRPSRRGRRRGSRARRGRPGR